MDIGTCDIVHWSAAPHNRTANRAGFWVYFVLVLNVIRCSCHYFLYRILFHHDFYQTSFIPWKYRYSYLHHYNGHLAKHVFEWQYDIIWLLSLRHSAAVMIATSHNMVHGALRIIIIHIKEYWNKRVRLTHRGPVNTDIVLCITYLIVYLQWDCFILFKVSPRYLKWSIYQHPICGSKYWPGTEQASCHYMKQRWPFWQMHIWVLWPQWVNELSALLKTEYQWRGEYARSG